MAARFRVGNQYMPDDLAECVGLLYQFIKVTLTFVPSMEVVDRKKETGRLEIRWAVAVIMLIECSLMSTTKQTNT